jgi:hypothetical protein
MRIWDRDAGTTDPFKAAAAVECLAIAPPPSLATMNDNSNALA